MGTRLNDGSVGHIGADYTMKTGNQGELQFFIMDRSQGDQKIRLDTAHLRGYTP